MVDVIELERIRALLAGKIGSDGSRYGSVDGHRSMTTMPSTSRRRCSCCGAQQTHVGLGDGVALMGGCELRVRRWVRDGYRQERSNAVPTEETK